MTVILDVRNVSAAGCGRDAGRAAPGAWPRRDVGPLRGTLAAGGGTTPSFGIIVMVIPNGGGMTASTRAVSGRGPASARGDRAWHARRLRRRREVTLEQRQDGLAVLAHDLGGALGVPGARRLDEGVVLTLAAPRDIVARAIDSEMGLLTS